MGEVKSHEFDGFLRGAARSVRVFVIYGPDRGLVSERAAQIAAMTGIALDDPFAVIKLDASAISVDDAVDAVLKGDKDGFVHAMHKIVTSKTAVFLVLQACLRQFQLLDLMRAEMDEKRSQAGQVVATLGRHLHFRRKPVIEKALKSWDGPSIRREMQKLQSAILQSRQRQSLEDSVAMQTLLSSVLQSARR